MALGHYHYSAVVTDCHPNGFVLQLHSPDLGAGGSPVPENAPCDRPMKHG